MDQDGYFVDPANPSPTRYPKPRVADDRGYVVRRSVLEEGTRPEYLIPVASADGVWGMMKRVAKSSNEGWFSLWKGAAISYFTISGPHQAPSRSANILCHRPHIDHPAAGCTQSLAIDVYAFHGPCVINISPPSYSFTPDHRVHNITPGSGQDAINRPISHVETQKLHWATRRLFANPATRRWPERNLSAPAPSLPNYSR